MWASACMFVCCQLNSIILYGLLSIQLDASNYISMTLKWNKTMIKRIQFTVSFIFKFASKIFCLFEHFQRILALKLKWVIEYI